MSVSKTSKKNPVQAETNEVIFEEISNNFRGEGANMFEFEKVRRHEDDYPNMVLKFELTCPCCSERGDGYFLQVLTIDADGTRLLKCEECPAKFILALKGGLGQQFAMEFSSHITPEQREKYRELKAARRENVRNLRLMRREMKKAAIAGKVTN